MADGLTTTSSYEDATQDSYDSGEEGFQASAQRRQQAQQQRHTHFLDLTDGSGGNASSSAAVPYGGGYAQEEATLLSIPHPNPNPSSATKPRRQAKGGGSGMATTASSLSTTTTSGAFAIDPNTPGRVVESGQEHTGRWTKEEHEAFLGALQMYGKEWKKVAAKVKTRTVVQTRTHAQKYFQKLHKARAVGQTGDVEMGVAPSSEKKMTKNQLQRKQHQQQQSTTPPPPPPPPPTSNKPHKAQRTQSTTAAGHLLSSLAQVGHVNYGTGSSTSSATAFSAPSHGFGQSAAAGGVNSTTATDRSMPQAYGNTQFFGGGNTGGGTTTTATTSRWGVHKIVAPDPSHVPGFPEPSPAATGKRKLAELAAAQMLAGVSAGTLPGGGRLLEGAETPPPPEETVPAAKKPTLGALQIVNPDMFPTMEPPRRIAGGIEEPTTPWDGQLEALVRSEIKSKQNTDGMPHAPDLGDAAAASTAPPMAPILPEAPSINLHQDVGFDGSFHGTTAAANTIFPHKVLGPNHQRSILHRAVCEGNLQLLQRELFDATSVTTASTTARRKDAFGFAPMHSACALGLLNTTMDTHTASPLEIVKLLVGGGADSTERDAEENTPLHWAARAGDADVAHYLLLRNCPADAQNSRGDTALHWAMRAGRRGFQVVKVLLEGGARAFLMNSSFRRPLDVAASGYSDDATTTAEDDSTSTATTTRKKNKALRSEAKRKRAERLEEKRESRANLLLLSAQSRTLVLHHPECLEHIPKSYTDWEVPDRVESIMRRILAASSSGSGCEGIFPHEVTISTDFERAKLDLLSRVHSADYLGFVNDLSKELAKKQCETEEASSDKGNDGTLTPPHVVPFTPMVQKSMLAAAVIKKEAHSDTAFSAGSLRAARRAAGAVQHAVDCVLVGRHRNAFCVVRPPGHHAGVKGLLAGGESCGFCIFNNVAAGALHAISDERLQCQRCAIVDIDVHHGNGTEEIVKRCHDPTKLFFFSIHLYDNDKRKHGYSFYPGTGDEDDIAHNIINVPIPPMWKEDKGGAQQLQQPVNTHNTRHKAKRKEAAAAAAAAAAASASSSVASTPRDSGGEEGYSDVPTYDAVGDVESDGWSKGSAASSSRQASSSRRSPSDSPRYSLGGGRHAYRKAIQNRLLPALRAFNPDLILISTGFDASRGDVGNARHYLGGKEKMGLDLEPDDYAWTTRRIMEIADICCQGRVVSVLEGGYGRTPTESSCATSSPEEERQQLLDKTVFSECAVRHLHAMIDPYDAEARFLS